MGSNCAQKHNVVNCCEAQNFDTVDMIPNLKKKKEWKN